MRFLFLLVLLTFLLVSVAARLRRNVPTPPTTGQPNEHNIIPISHAQRRRGFGVALSRLFSCHPKISIRHLNSTDGINKENFQCKLCYSDYSSDLPDQQKCTSDKHIEFLDTIIFVLNTGGKRLWRTIECHYTPSQRFTLQYNMIDPDGINRFHEEFHGGQHANLLVTRFHCIPYTADSTVDPQTAGISIKPGGETLDLRTQSTQTAPRDVKTPIVRDQQIV